jgi:hypothetical protein
MQVKLLNEKFIHVTHYIIKIKTLRGIMNNPTLTSFSNQVYPGLSNMNPPVTSKEVKEMFSKEFVTAMREICEENFENMEKYASEPSRLGKGIYYGNQYYHALKATGQIKRLQFLVDQGAFYHGWTSPKKFTHTLNSSSPSGKVINHCVIKTNVSASEALKALREGPTLLGCGEAIGIAQYMALEKVLGSKKFNVLFSSSSPTPLITSGRSLDALRKVTPLKNIKDTEVGNANFIIGLPKCYQAKHINGEAQAYNVVCCSAKPTFLGLGLDPKGEGVGLKEITRRLLDEYNQVPETMELFDTALAERIKSTYASEALMLSACLKNHTFTMDEFTRMNGGQVYNRSMKADAYKLAQLINGSEEEGLTLMASWVKT